MSTQPFADLGVSPAVVDALSKRRIHGPFAIQRLVIGDVLAGRDVLAKSPTGSGKTLAFAAPIADRLEADEPRPAALVLAPTRELASQIVEESRAVAHPRALSVAAGYGGVGLEKQARNPRPGGHPTSSPASWRWSPRPGSIASCVSSTAPTPRARWCSSAPSAGPTASSSACAGAASRRPPCTATSPRPSARRRSPASRRA